MAAEALEEGRTGAEGAVQVERGDRAARPLPEAFAAGDQDDGPVVALDEPRSHDPDHAFVPVFSPDDIRAPTSLRLGPVFDLCDRRAKDLVLDRLPVAVQLLETIGEKARLVGVFGQEQLERRARMAEPARGVDAGREPEPDLAGVDCRRIDARDLHQGAQAELLRAGERSEPGNRQRPVLAHERHDVGDRRKRDEVEVTSQKVGLWPEQGLAELVDDARAAKLRERVVGRASRDDRTVRQLVARPVVIGDDDVETEFARPAHFLDRGDAAVDREDEPATFRGQSFERLAADAVALVEAARQMPLDVGSELAQDEHREDGCADPVDVVVAVDADPLAGRDCRVDRLDRRVHGAEQPWIVQGLLAGQVSPRLVGVAVAAPDEHACRDLAEVELLREVARLPVRARTDGPDAL